jgi:sugar lactone lactonase YvrE
VTTPTIEAWSHAPGVLTEGPRWHEERCELFWVDILASTFHRARHGDGGSAEALTTVTLDRHVGAAAPAAGGGYVLAAGQGFLFLDDSGDVTELAQPDAGHTEVRMNDGACDAEGRFWAGTMAYDVTPGAGVLYRLELDGSCSTVLTGLTISNGIGWSPDGKTMYLNDSGTGLVEAFDFDPASGDISGRRTLVSIPGPDIGPDGLTVDEEGGIWVAVWGGAEVRRYDPQGGLVETVHLPVTRPTSCAFGGPDCATLFVTSARNGLDDDELARQPDAGRLFRVEGLGVRGMPVLPYRGLVRPA